MKNNCMDIFYISWSSLNVNKSHGLVTSALTAITVGCIKHCVVGDCFQTQSTVSFVISWNYRECLSFLAPMWPQRHVNSATVQNSEGIGARQISFKWWVTGGIAVNLQAQCLIFENKFNLKKKKKTKWIYRMRKENYKRYSAIEVSGVHGLWVPGATCMIWKASANYCML